LKKARNLQKTPPKGSDSKGGHFKHSSKIKLESEDDDNIQQIITNMNYFVEEEK
jgi:hypothetical protein